MKKLLFLLAFSLSAHAEIEIGMGSITQHFWGGKEVGERYSGKLNDRGLIFNSLNSLAVIDGTKKYTFFYGSNSVSLPMMGLKFTGFFYQGEVVEAGFFWGAYLQDNYAFTEKSGLIPVFAFGDIMPVVGAEVNFTIYNSKDGMKIGINNNITPALSAHALTLQVDF